MPGNVQKLYLAVVALIGLYMLVALLFGIPSVRIIGHAALGCGSLMDRRDQDGNRHLLCGRARATWDGDLWLFIRRLGQ